MEPRSCHHRPGNRLWTPWVVGLASLLWLLLRSGSHPRRLAYPCQRAALVSSVGFLGYLAALLGLAPLYLLARRLPLARTGLVAAVLVLTLVQGGGQLPRADATVTLDLPAWTSPSAVSDVFVVANVATPQCSLDGGALPASGACHDPATAFADSGVDRLVAEMAARGTPFYATSGHPDGIVGADDVVVVKVNNQWGAQGEGAGVGRLATSTDVLKGVIWRVLQHPDGFTGEVVVAENTQYANANWDTTPANAQDQDQSYQDVVNAFQSQGYPVSTAMWDYLLDVPLTGGSVDGGMPPAEYASGNDESGYVLLEDPDGSGADELSYPKFRTEAGTRVSMRYGIWDGSGYDRDRLTLLNLPVLKKHGMAGSTICWKNLIGFVSIGEDPRRYGDWDRMHDFYWGYTNGPDRDYGLIGRQLARVCAPDLNIVDAIWVGTQDNTSGPAVRANALVASTDPFAADWYASEYILRPVAEWGPEDSSAARGGTFRSATRVNQNSARAQWQDGQYPWIDLDDDFDGSEPSSGERNQMNAYLAGGTGPSCTLSCNGSAAATAEVGEAVAFSGSATATGCSGQPAFRWQFGDGATSSSEDPSHAYGEEGSFDWALTVTVDGQTCTDSGTVEVGGGQPPPDYQLLVPAVAHAPGAAGTQWRTALALLNLAGADAEVDLTLVTAQGSETHGVTLGAYTSVEWFDVAVDLFARPPDAQVSGVIHVASTHTVLATSRTYNQTPQGTYGQYLPALTVSSCLAQGQLGYLLQIKANSDFRTNVGFANRGQTEAVVRAQLHDDWGQAVGEPIEATVAAGSWVQRNDVFASTGAGPHELGYATVEVVSGSAVWAYASVVDNRTGDATTIPVLVE